MIILIDGYNLLHLIFPGSKSNFDRHRKQFIKQLAFYQQERPHIKQIIVVFDAGPLHHATREVKNGIVIMFSGQRSSADDWIIDYATKNDEKKIVVVTKDRAVQRGCKNVGAELIEVETFYRYVQESLEGNAAQALTFCYNEKAPIRKIDQEDVPELEGFDEQNTQSLDLLMEQASMNIPDSALNEEIKKSREPKKYTLSKKKKKQQALRKKLK